jgi:hypothetical protein
VISAVHDTAVYVYGVLDPDAPVPPAVETVEHGGLVALVREVSLDEFGEEALATNLNDREWLERHVCAHEDVLAGAAETATVVPFRFGVICHDRSDVARLLDEHADLLRRDLLRVRGCDELGVKVWYDAPDAHASDEAPAGGRAYLERRRDDRRMALELAAEREALVDDAHRRLTRYAVASVVNRPQPKELSGRGEPMLLNAAYLVRRGDEALAREVAALHAEHATNGYAFELTGPWPPYNFVGERA